MTTHRLSRTDVKNNVWVRRHAWQALYLMLPVLAVTLVLCLAIAFVGAFLGSPGNADTAGGLIGGIALGANCMIFPLAIGTLVCGVMALLGKTFRIPMLAGLVDRRMEK